MGVADLLTGLLPRPSIDEHACSRRLGSGCSVCVDACPKQALQLTLAGSRVNGKITCNRSGGVRFAGETVLRTGRACISPGASGQQSASIDRERTGRHDYG